MMTSANVDELRRQLNQANSEIERLAKQVTQHESVAISYRNERNEIMDDKNRLQSSLDVNNIITQRKLERGNKKIKDLELKLEIQAIKIEKLNYDLMASLTDATQLSTQVAVWENKSRVENDKFETCKAKLMSDLQASQLDEINFKSQVEELQSEIRLQITGSHLKAADAVANSEVQKELKEALQQNSEKDRELSDLRLECHKLKTNLKTIELKYSNEIQLHSSDLQAFTLCKDKLEKATEMLKAALLENESIEKQANEFEERLVNLTDHNKALYDLLQDHNTKVTSENIVTNSDLNPDSSVFSRSLTNDEIDNLSSPKLLSIVKYLRRERDTFAANIEVLKTENIRLVSEYDMQKKQLNELIQQQVTVDKSSVNEADMCSEYDDLKRNEATFNSITDSNIRLAVERDALLINVRDLTERAKKAEDEFVVLQEKHVVLASRASKTEKLQSEGTKRALKMAEESKQLQNERVSLHKLFTTEKVRLNAKINLLEGEKLRLEEDVAAANKKLNTTIDEKKKIQNEFNNQQLTSLRLTEELTEVKSKISNKNFEFNVLQEKLASKYAELSNTKIKETQIRTCAKKYKKLYFELKAKTEASKARLAKLRLEEQIEMKHSSLQKKRNPFYERTFHVHKTMCGLDNKYQLTPSTERDEKEGGVMDVKVEDKDDDRENKANVDDGVEAEIDSKEGLFTQEQDEGQIYEYKVRNDTNDIDETVSFSNSAMKLEAYEEIGGGSIFPSTSTLHTGFSESVACAHPIVAHVIDQLDGQNSTIGNDSVHQRVVVVKLKRLRLTDVGTEHNKIQIEESRETITSNDDAHTGRRRSRRIGNGIGLSTQHQASPQQGVRKPIVRTYRETVTSTRHS